MGDQRFGRAKISTIQRDFRNLRTAIRSGDWDATEAAWEKCERWLVMDVPVIASRPDQADRR